MMDFGEYQPSEKERLKNEHSSYCEGFLGGDINCFLGAYREKLSLLIFYYFIKEFLVNYISFTEGFILDFSNYHYVKDYINLDNEKLSKKIFNLLSETSSICKTFSNISNIEIVESKRDFTYIVTINYKTLSHEKAMKTEKPEFGSGSGDYKEGTLFHSKKLNKFSLVLKKIENELGILSYEKEMSYYKGKTVMWMRFSNIVKPQLDSFDENGDINKIASFDAGKQAECILRYVSEDKSTSRWTISEIQNGLKAKSYYSESIVGVIKPFKQIFKKIDPQYKKIYFPELRDNFMAIRWEISELELEEIRKG